MRKRGGRERNDNNSIDQNNTTSFSFTNLKAGNGVHIYYIYIIATATTVFCY